MKVGCCTLRRPFVVERAHCNPTGAPMTTDDHCSSTTKGQSFHMRHHSTPFCFLSLFFSFFVTSRILDIFFFSFSPAPPLWHTFYLVLSFVLFVSSSPTTCRTKPRLSTRQCWQSDSGVSVASFHNWHSDADTSSSFSCQKRHTVCACRTQHYKATADRISLKAAFWR